jgi:AcrR family transcriptional regulator
MLKAGAQKALARDASVKGSSELPTKERIIQAALVTLKEMGFAGTSARAVARRGNFNQALIFYHFGTLDDLMLAALDRTSSERMARYREAIREASSLEAKVHTAAQLYAEDLQSGHITVISELVTGSLSRPGLGPEVVKRMEPWVQFAEEAITGIISDFGLQQMIDPKIAAFGVVALYLGVDLLSHLDGDHSRAESMFEAASRAATLLAPLLGSR